MIETCYKIPWEVYNKNFPNGNEEEFNKSFITFDISEDEFKYFQKIVSNNYKLVCLETVVFNLHYILSEFDINNLPNNKFRKNESFK